MKLRRMGLLTKIILAGLVLYATISLLGFQAKVARTQQEHEQLQERVAALTRENEGLKYELSHSADPAIIEDIARNKLGLVKPGEKIFYDVGR